MAACQAQLTTKAYKAINNFKRKSQVKWVTFISRKTYLVGHVLSLLDTIMFYSNTTDTFML